VSLTAQQVDAALAKCGRFACLGNPVAAPVLRVWPRGMVSRDPGYAMQLHVPIAFCEHHVKAIYPRELFGGDMGWARFVAQSEQRGASPDKESLRIEWISLERMRAWLLDRLQRRAVRGVDLRTIGRGPISESLEVGGADAVDLDLAGDGEQG